MILFAITDPCHAEWLLNGSDAGGGVASYVQEGGFLLFNSIKILLEEVEDPDIELKARNILNAVLLPFVHYSIVTAKDSGLPLAVLTSFVTSEASYINKNIDEIKLSEIDKLEGRKQTISQLKKLYEKFF